MHGLSALIMPTRLQTVAQMLLSTLAVATIPFPTVSMEITLADRTFRFMVKMAQIIFTTIKATI